MSTTKPLSNSDIVKQPYLFQDLSSVPPRLVELWITEFLNQTAQKKFWEPRTFAQITLELRTTIAIAADGLPIVAGSLKTWIEWVK